MGIDFSKVIEDVVCMCDGEQVVPFSGQVVPFKEYEFPGGFNYLVGNFYIKSVIYNDPATIVIWSDGTKTVSKTHADDKYSPEVGLVLCVLKKLTGSTKVHDLIDAWIPHNNEKVVSVSDVRRRQRGSKVE